MGFAPVVTRKEPAPRLDTLDGKTVYLVDCRFDDSDFFLEQIQAVARHAPTRTSGPSSADLEHLPRRRSGDLGGDPGPGRAAIVGVGHWSTCAPAVAAHG